ncbi:MAG TPA: hypothetical protein PLQ13_05475, partial [Candidatus Krumholzibacteria bacterium]|nr:hypothetical protein [Candidatus Krumholzibacteria bacterium]
MSRGMPWSVLLHVLLISLAVLYGNTVQRRVLEPPLLMRAHLVPSSVLADAAVTPAQEQPAPEASPPPQEAPELPPKEVPVERPKPKETPKTEAKPKPPQPKPEQKPAESLQKPADAGETGPVQPSLSGPSVQGTDTNFPFAWYLSTVESQVARNWRPRQLGFGERSRVSCAVHFVIGRN